MYEVDYSTVLGHGRQGSVYAGLGPEGDAVAVKVVQLRTGAGTEPWYRDVRHALRESIVGAHVDAAGIDGVVPLLGQYLGDGYLVLLFPRADFSLDALIAARRQALGELVTRTADPDTSAMAPTSVASGSDGTHLAPPSDDDVRRIAVELATTLAQLHSRGVMHRDVKPGNALFWNGSWRWSDLGIARVLEQPTATFTFTLGGTLDYAAPEVISRTDQTLRSDVYSLGCTIFELATGYAPFTTDPARQHLTDVPDVDAISDPVARRAVTYALAKSPGSRPSAEELVAMLTGITGTSTAHDRFRELALRGRRREEKLTALSERASRRAQDSQDALAQFRRIWDDFVEAARAIDRDARARSEDENRSSLRLYDDQMYVIRTAPGDGRCPATAVGLISMQRANESSRAVANVYAQLENGNDVHASRWQLVQLQPNLLRPGTAQRSRERPVVSMDVLEEWLTSRDTVKGPPDFVVVAENELTVSSLLDLFVNEVDEAEKLS